jgi:hypothetical protein
MFGFFFFFTHSWISFFDASFARPDMQHGSCERSVHRSANAAESCFDQRTEMYNVTDRTWSSLSTDPNKRQYSINRMHCRTVQASFHPNACINVNLYDPRTQCVSLTKSEFTIHLWYKTHLYTAFNKIIRIWTTCSYTHVSISFGRQYFSDFLLSSLNCFPLMSLRITQHTYASWC